MATEKWKQIAVYFSQPQSTNIYFNNQYYFAGKKCFEQSHCLQVKKTTKAIPTLVSYYEFQSSFLATLVALHFTPVSK